ncbi:MAG: hypothetical protein JXK07_15440 [Spirochaetes bacterium]|nr:hypothetical protein [Spirochaetota bacterium]
MQTIFKNLKRKKKLVLVLLAMCLFMLLLSVFFFGECKGCIIRTFYAPDLIEDNRIVQIAHETYLQNEQKKEFYEAYNNKKGFYGLVFKKITLEGRPIQIFVISDNGQAQVIIDYTRDPYSNRNYKNIKPLAIILGFKSKDGHFQDIIASKKDSYYVLKIEYPDDVICL